MEKAKTQSVRREIKHQRKSFKFIKVITEERVHGRAAVPIAPSRAGQTVCPPSHCIKPPPRSKTETT